ncbi:uncharacterized protein LOC116417836 isoform X2 [Nasonia vitripennis]|uniref:Uncharacterized protein n=1 Tax=Nasonia vitripennis TaxID=7425 RepID=A0A7M7QK08_NASVI|nr:uncharacterized protein LOC116417836 isoform X2 [Nasonia vitripennis]
MKIPTFHHSLHQKNFNFGLSLIRRKRIKLQVLVLDRLLYLSILAMLSLRILLSVKTEKHSNKKSSVFSKSGMLWLDAINSLSDRELLVNLTLLVQTVITNKCREEISGCTKFSNFKDKTDELFEFERTI